MLSSRSSQPGSLQPLPPISQPTTAELPPAGGTARAAAEHSSGARRDIAEIVSERLAESSYFVLRNVWCDFHEGVLCLRGKVPSYFLKQMAQTIACQVDGVEECMNRIEVTSPVGLPSPAKP